MCLGVGPRRSRSISGPLDNGGVGYHLAVSLQRLDSRDGVNGAALYIGYIRWFRACRLSRECIIIVVVTVARRSVETCGCGQTSFLIKKKKTPSRSICIINAFLSKESCVCSRIESLMCNTRWSLVSKKIRDDGIHIYINIARSV